MKKIKKITAMFLAVSALLCGCAAADNIPAETAAQQEVTVDISCAEAAAAALDTEEELPPVMQVSDAQMLSDVMGYDMSITEDSCVYTQLVSAHLFELAVIKPLKGSEEQAEEMLRRRQSYLKDQAAFYPAQVEAADASLLGEKDGYYYLICDKNSALIEEKLKSVI